MCELDVNNEMHPSRRISEAFGKDEGATKIAKEQLIELNLLTEQNKLFLSTPLVSPLGLNALFSKTHRGQAHCGCAPDDVRPLHVEN